jgi:hypothetical protein
LAPQHTCGQGPQPPGLRARDKAKVRHEDVRQSLSSEDLRLAERRGRRGRLGQVRARPPRRSSQSGTTRPRSFRWRGLVVPGRTVPISRPRCQNLTRPPPHRSLRRRMRRPAVWLWRPSGAPTYSNRPVPPLSVLGHQAAIWAELCPIHATTAV